MATWKVTPDWKKSVIERTEWIKDDQRMIHETGWRWGEFIVYTDDDTPPELEPGVDIFACGYESEMVECTDGCWEECDYDECDDETREFVEEFLEENSIYDLEEHGWYCSETEMIIDCDMDIEMIKPTGDAKPETETKGTWPN